MKQTPVKQPAKAAAATVEVDAVPPPASLESFRDGGGVHSGFQFTRYWWQGEGEREGIAPVFEAKIQMKTMTALRHEVLLPAHASSEYMDRRLLLSRYDAMLPSFFYDAYAQVKIKLIEDEPLHMGYEMVRAYARRYFVLGLALPAVLVLHAPFLSGSRNPAHVHIMIPARQLGQNGWGVAARELCSDKGHLAALEAWKAFELEWLEGRGD